MFRKSKFQRKRGTTTTPPCIFTSLFVNACIPTTYTKHSTPNTFSSPVVSTPERLYLENVSMHSHQTLFNPSIASLLPYICIPSFQLRLIKNDFYVLRKKKKHGSTILASTVFPGISTAKKKRFPVIQNDPVFGVSIIKAVPSQRQWRC